MPHLIMMNLQLTMMALYHINKCWFATKEQKNNIKQHIHIHVTKFQIAQYVNVVFIPKWYIAHSISECGFEGLK